MGQRIVLGDLKQAKHLYMIEARDLEKNEIRSVEVHAQNRDHAGRLAESAGYEVRSVNMIG